MKSKNRNIIAVVNQKGGVGKTTSVLNIATALAGFKKNVLVIDSDPQGNLSQSLGLNLSELKHTLFEVLKEEIPFNKAIFKHKKIDIIPSNIKLSASEVELASVAGREFLLKESLKNSKEYDYILIDCPPNLGLLTLNALVASNQIFVPVQSEYLAMQGITQLINTVKLVKKRLNPDLKIAGVFITIFDKRKNLHKEVSLRIKDFFKEIVFETKIFSSVALAESPSFGLDIFEYKPNDKGSNNYLELTKEILKRNE